MMKLAPICLFTYNRLDETQQTINHLKDNHLAEQSELFLFSDGPKNEVAKPKVEAVRSYLKTVTGFKKIHVKESEVNKGLASSIISGVSEVIEAYGWVIVMEDDLLTAPNFLDFMNQGLDFYKNDSEILSMSGYTMDLPSLPGEKDFYFGYRASSWGWATWIDRWQKIDWEVTDYDRFHNDRKRKRSFNRGGSDLSRMLKLQMAGELDSWAIRFCYHQFKHDLKTVYPTRSKLINIGFGEDATHTAGTKRFRTDMDTTNKRDFHFEKFDKMDATLVREFAQKFSIFNRALDKIRQLIS